MYVKSKGSITLDDHVKMGLTSIHDDNINNFVFITKCQQSPKVVTMQPNQSR